MLNFWKEKLQVIGTENGTRKELGFKFLHWPVFQLHPLIHAQETVPMVSQNKDSIVKNRLTLDLI